MSVFYQIKQKIDIFKFFVWENTGEKSCGVYEVLTPGLLRLFKLFGRFKGKYLGIALAYST